MGRVQITKSNIAINSIFDARAVNLTERRTNEIKEACQEECPVQTGYMRSQHMVIRVGYRNFRMLVNTDYALEVFDGRGPEGPRRPNRWLDRGLDRVAAAHAH